MVQFSCSADLFLLTVLVLLTHFRGFPPINATPHYIHLVTGGPTRVVVVSQVSSRNEGTWKGRLDRRYLLQTFKIRIDQWHHHDDPSSYGEGNWRHILPSDQTSILTKSLSCCRFKDHRWSLSLIENAIVQRCMRDAQPKLFKPPARLQHDAILVPCNPSQQILPLSLSSSCYCDERSFPISAYLSCNPTKTCTRR